jgi:hypothetical protein
MSRLTSGAGFMGFCYFILIHFSFVAAASLFAFFSPFISLLGHCCSLHYSLKGIKVQLRGEEIAARWREIES